ncbi:hypothetical protein HPB50_005194 [Hyalomma asiaticum]|uniref:Uncharacterized protein n=1 Tax=Hyalomma asiaticum TaxID=266040 RepID=A0ACB7S465_HYAAI|nr:hypothetical protein HPB50_005194 [Hyalomma asiaticum]
MRRPRTEASLARATERERLIHCRLARRAAGMLMRRTYSLFIKRTAGRPVHSDVLGPVDKKVLLVPANAHSKWIKVCVHQKTTAYYTIQCLQDSFYRFDVRYAIAIETRSKFVSEEFKCYVKDFVTFLLTYTTRRLRLNEKRQDTFSLDSQLRTRLHAIEPSVGKKVAQQKLAYTMLSEIRERLFNISDEVLSKSSDLRAAVAPYFIQGSS